MPLLSEDEKRIMDYVKHVHNQITAVWGLSANTEELTAAIHVIQLFIIQHVLAREAPKEFNNWYKS